MMTSGTHTSMIGKSNAMGYMSTYTSAAAPGLSLYAFRGVLEFNQQLQWHGSK